MEGGGSNVIHDARALGEYEEELIPWTMACVRSLFLVEPDPAPRRRRRLAWPS